jgi:hypothetical protein
MARRKLVDRHRKLLWTAARLRIATASFYGLPQAW